MLVLLLAITACAIPSQVISYTGVYCCTT
uniref:Uncharacterized protein n=1 Tax=Anguilla anguilla TaxID=7936 RepID=A0A0E9UXR4_ANGAN